MMSGDLWQTEGMLGGPSSEDRMFESLPLRKLPLTPIGYLLRPTSNIYKNVDKYITICHKLAWRLSL